MSSTNFTFAISHVKTEEVTITSRLQKKIYNEIMALLYHVRR